MKLSLFYHFSLMTGKKMLCAGASLLNPHGLRGVGVHEDDVLGLEPRADAVVFIALIGVEVENEQEIPSLEHDQLVLLMGQGNVLVGTHSHPLEPLC